MRRNPLELIEVMLCFPQQESLIGNINSIIFSRHLLQEQILAMAPLRLFHFPFRRLHINFVLCLRFAHKLVAVVKIASPWVVLVK